MAKVTRLSLDNSDGQDRRRLHLREISDGADSPLETVGLDLRKARLRKGEDLAQIARALKIRKDYLDALEESRFESLPGRAYAIGFVRTYAEYLGLDESDCVERLKGEMAGRGETQSLGMALSPARERKLPQGGYILIALLVIVVAYAGYYLFDSYRLASPAVTPVPDRLVGEAGLAPHAAPAPNPPPSRLTPSAAPVEPAVQADTPQATTTSNVPGTVVPPAPATLPPAPAAPPAAQDVLPKGIVYGAVNKTSRITLRAHKATRVTVLGANSRIFLDRELQPGDTYLVPNMVGLTLTALDGSAVELILDGGSLGYVAKDGAPAKSLSLNPQDVIDHEQHL